MKTERRDVSISGAVLTGVFEHLRQAVRYIEKNRKEGDQEGYEASAFASMAIATLEFLIIGRKLPNELQEGLDNYMRTLETSHKTLVEIKTGD